MTKRRRFNDDFKAKVALEALRGDRAIQEIATRHKVYPNQVSTWKRQAMITRDQPDLNRFCFPAGQAFNLSGDRCRSPTGGNNQLQGDVRREALLLVIPLNVEPINIFGSFPSSP